MKCLCKLEIGVIEWNADCPVHPGFYTLMPAVPPLPHVMTYGELVQQLSALEMNHETVAAFATEAKKTLQALAFNTTVFVESRSMPRVGRWRCPVCNHWVDKHGGWHIVPEEEICGRCYLIFTGGKPEEQGDDQWLPR